MTFPFIQKCKNTLCIKTKSASHFNSPTQIYLDILVAHRWHINSGGDFEERYHDLANLFGICTRQQKKIKLLLFFFKNHTHTSNVWCDTMFKELNASCVMPPHFFIFCLPWSAWSCLLQCQTKVTCCQKQITLSSRVTGKSPC